MCDRLCLPQWVCPFCPMSPFSKRGALPGVRARMGVAPLCAHPLAARAPLLLRVTPLLGEGSPGPRARARTRVSPPGPFVSVWVLPSHGVGAPDPCGCPRVVSLTLSGGGCASPAFVAAPSAVATHSSSIAHPCVLITCYCARVVPGSCRVRHLCAGFRSLVFVNISARLVLCIFVCATCFPEKGSRVRGWPLLSPRRETGWGGMNAARSPPPRLFGASSRPSRLREEKGGPQRR